ncbi:zinc finger BED domain-containing protein 4-like isoform X1 [Lates japonicus]|uniref:Zinc finger BED domain-containing protein 4-like isoform X1 n=1 Tax=Lates japonicus TaxID=270547 RepID=A0AAD3M6X4_LATJO|nr:zinc finger BED domain-containing protein 4-like isoform X1 [Lates japonicus]
MAFPVRDIIATLKSCAGHFGHSVLAKQRLRAIQEELGLPTHSINQAVQTRWNSTLHMLQRMFEQRCALNVYASDHGHISCPSAAQWDIVSNLIETLEPLEEVTLEMSHSESSASCVIPSISVLKMMLQHEGPSSAGIKTLRTSMLDSLTRRFSKAEDTKCLVLATVLDPRYKDKAFTSAETVEKAKDWLKEEAAHDTAKTVEETGEAEAAAKRQRVQTDPPPTLVDSLYAKLLGTAHHTDAAQSSFDTELECYLKLPVVERSSQPLEWWKKNEERFQRLAVLARKYLCPPPSTVPSE